MPGQNLMPPTKFEQENIHNSSLVTLLQTSSQNFMPTGTQVGNLVSNGTTFQPSG